jgi:O-acetyl-ADP-ribose deacetylase (regulator of RNase III)
MTLEIQGDILQVGKDGLICHQVNYKKVAGKGLALQIRNQISGWYGHFKTIDGKLGDVDYFHVGDTVIASLYAQEGYGTAVQQTNYEYLRKCLAKVNLYAERHWKKVYIPEGLGCGLGGGSWSEVKVIIEETVPDAVIVRLK